MTVSQMRRKRRKLRREIKYGLYGLGVVTFLLLLLLVFIPLVDQMRLSSMGYSRESVKAIASQKLSKEVLKREYSSAFDVNMAKGVQAKDNLELYYVSTEVDDQLILLNNRLLAKGYTETDLLKGYASLHFKEMTPLLLFNNVTDMEAYVQDVIANRTVAESFVSNLYTVFYENSVASDNVSDITVLVNKYHHIDATYAPELVNVPVQYASSGVTLRSDAYEAFREMVKAMKADGLTGIYITSGYRSYATQESLYNRYITRKGQEWTDRYSARPGSSEHQLGLAVDVTATADASASFDTTPEYEWLMTHAHEYGYILRYTKENEEITGYGYEPWHYRYLGVEMATKVYQSNLTYDEYYELYVRPAQ